ncbi:hypothetical protein L1987_49029 [Smallanthus sonchifolius]|uniref:Uncharacterized protein n=1 Tax=Smallanthus sonchifolius TaxID=185202 RepID=A0ACB9FSY3_9ASTR|nr:hypothetical protein L1987_49029 [Smallanthus sonchifolius]
MECNEMQTLFDQEDFYKHRNKSTSHGEDEILGSLQYLSIHFLKKLQRISEGPIGRNSLSCLRILALHTCPELTSIFTEYLLHNLQSLTEIIVEDCPKVNCLVNLEEGAPWSNGPFLPNLRRISLLDLPELVSVSGGVCIAPQLDTLLVFNCMKLDYLSDMEIPRDTMAIKGEIEWWDALKSGKLTWESVFVQLKRDGSLMDQLAEDTNSLQHFLQLEMDPSLPGQVNQNSSRDSKKDREHVDQLQIVHNVDLSNETRKMSTLEILNCNNGTQSQYAGTAFKMWEPPSPVSGKPDNKDTNCILKAPNHKLAFTKNSVCTSRHQVKVNKGIEIEKALDDGYNWRKYGEKSILGSKYPRYDPEARQLPESASTITESLFDLARSPRVLDFNKIVHSKIGINNKRTHMSDIEATVCRKSISIRDAKWTKQLKVSPNTGFDVPPDDGYIWRKHGQHDILGAIYPSCDAKKLVQKSDNDLSIWIVTYKGIHTCLGLPESDSTCESESALSILKSSDSSTTIESELMILKNNGFSTTAESTSTITDNSFGLNFTKKMSGSASIQRWKQQAEEIQSPSLKLQLPSFYEPNPVIISEVAVNCSRNLSSSTKTPQNEKQCPSPVLKARKENMSDRITELQQLVSPFGKAPKQDLRSQGLCLVPVSSTSPVTNQPTTDGEPPEERNAEELFPYADMV